jgi:hypothetical protein
MHDFLTISPKISVAPVIHGSGDCAVEVRRLMLAEHFDCLAVPLPESFQQEVERGIDYLPSISLVVQEEPPEFGGIRSDEEDDSEMTHRVSYVPIDPCQPVIAALRVALQERMPRRFIDLEVERFETYGLVLPDPYALKEVSLERFAAASLPVIPRVPDGQPANRVRVMAERLRELEQQFDKILLVCSMTDWPWIREAYTENLAANVSDEPVDEAHLLATDESSLTFMLGELPFVTGLYEQARAELDDDENLSFDGIKRLLLASRDRYKLELKSLARRITPKLMTTYFTYVRNLRLIESRMTPDLYTLVLAAQQVFGDQFAIELAETSRTYPYPSAIGLSLFRMSIDRGELPDGRICETVSRLPGHPMSWRTCELKNKPLKIDRERWETQWNPFSHCSWPAEDVAIEKFRNHVKDVALGIMGTDLAKTEKFSTSMKDGLDIRETLRNWHTGDLYVKVFPPQLGHLDCVLMFFDSPADPRDYPWRITWQAEHHDESTLALFATSFEDEMVGPGIALSQYGGAMFLFPPRDVVDIWRDPRLDFVDTLEERLLVAACINSEERHIAVLSEGAPGIGWRRLAKKYGKKLVHVPLGRFSQETIQQLRMVHVLNGHEVRSYASHFIRKS